MSSIQIKDNWEETVQRLDAWFRHEETERPLIEVHAIREEGENPFGALEPVEYRDDAQRYLDADKAFREVMNRYRTVQPLAEAFPQFSMNLGAGSMALYLGSEPVFRPDTVWFSHMAEDYKQILPLRYDPDNIWWKKHLELTRRQVELTRDTDILVCIPDIIENIDILASIRDPQTCCFDLYDYPDELRQALQNIEDIYMRYYDGFYNLVNRGGVSAYTVFGILGTGKTAKLQCDFGALLSPAQFDTYILPSLRRQCSELDNTLFHLDGPECLCHVDALMTLDQLGALQWTPGARNPMAGSEDWYPLYRKVREADKGLWIYLAEYSPEEAVYYADRLVKAFGHRGLFFHFPDMPRKQADALLLKAEREWRG